MEPRQGNNNFQLTTKNFKFMVPSKEQIQAQAAYDNGNKLAVGDLTKREYFAGLALSGLLADPNATNFPLIVTDAVALADKLLIELSKQP